MTDKERLIHEIFKLGFKDVTDKEPIKTIEQFEDDTFFVMHAYSNRYLKEETGFKHYLLLEIEGKIVDIEGKVIHIFGFSKFHIKMPLHLYPLLIKYIQDAINNLKEKVHDRQRDTDKGKRES